MKSNYGTIHFIITGGTIDSHFNPATDTVEIGGKTDVPDYIRKLKLHNKSECTELFLKDSRDILDNDRKKILQAVKDSPHKMIIITHGTYTMSDTAQYLRLHMGKIGKTVVLFGSMIPLKGFELSDAGFNLGYAVASVQALPHGIYVCMNGKVFAPDKVRKNRSAARFEEAP